MIHRNLCILPLLVDLYPMAVDATSTAFVATLKLDDFREIAVYLAREGERGPRASAAWLHRSVSLHGGVRVTAGVHTLRGDPRHEPGSARQRQSVDGAGAT